MACVALVTSCAFGVRQLLCASQVYASQHHPCQADVGQSRLGQSHNRCAGGLPVLCGMVVVTFAPLPGSPVLWIDSLRCRLRLYSWSGDVPVMLPVPAPRCAGCHHIEGHIDCVGSLWAGDGTLMLVSVLLAVCVVVIHEAATGELQQAGDQ